MSVLEVMSPRLLIVDDVADNRELLRRAFERRGYEIVEAEDGDAALAIVGQQHIDLVLLDIMMPGVSGLDVLRSLRAQYSQGRLPVIMVTACSGVADVVEALEAGANDYITKPVALPIAFARVVNQLERKRAENAHERAVVRLSATIRELEAELMHMRQAEMCRDPSARSPTFATLL